MVFRSGLYFYFESFLYPNPLGQDSPELADLFELREESGASLCQEVTKLTTALQEYQLMVQVTALKCELNVFVRCFDISRP